MKTGGFFQLIPTSGIPWSAPGQFDLARLLSTELPTRLYIMPRLQPDDLLNLEEVSQDAMEAIRLGRYWEPVYMRYLKEDAIAARINRRIGAERPMIDATGLLYRKRYLMVKEQKKQLELNIRDARFKQTFAPVPPESKRWIQSTAISGGTLFIAWQNQVGGGVVCLMWR